MQVEIKIDSLYEKPKVIILTATVTDEVTMMADRISNTPPQIVLGSNDKKFKILEQDDLIRVYSGNGKVFAVTEKGEYTTRLRLYEMEELLDANHFVRISNSEIINLKKVKNFDLNFTGTICVHLTNGTKTFVSRRYVSKVKAILGL